MNTVKRLLELIYTEYNEEFKEYIVNEDVYVFIEDGDGNLIEIRAIKEGENYLLDRKNNPYECPEDPDDILVMRRLNNWWVGFR